MTKKLVSFRLANDLQASLKERAAQEGISVTELVNRLLREGLSANESENSLEVRLSVLEEAVHRLTQMSEHSNVVSKSLQSPPALEQQLNNMEQRLREISDGVKEIRQNNPLDSPSVTAYSGHQEDNVLSLSLEDLRKLLKSGVP
ncbi:MAG: hypothetical protein AAF921_24565 [Cyanobacteria bacterium P01_D01_bin.44]